MKTIGIIGGMGPLATVDIFSKIVMGTKANSDNEHIPILIHNNTAIPDRTKAILQGGADPIPEMRSSALKLQEMGADFLIIPCNTAHYFYDRLAKEVSIPILHMIEETAKVVKASGRTKVGLLSTDGTIASGVYADTFAKQGITLVSPTPEHQVAVMEAIYGGVKAGNLNIDLTPLRETLASLTTQGIDHVILGCTELPIGFAQWNLGISYTDPTEILAKAAIKMASQDLETSE